MKSFALLDVKSTKMCEKKSMKIYKKIYENLLQKHKHKHKTQTISPYSWEDELCITLTFPLSDRSCLHFPYNILQMNYFINMFDLLTKPQCQKLSKFSGYRQTDQPSNLLLEAPT